MIDKKLIPDMSTPEGIEEAFEHVREYSYENPAEIKRIISLEILRIMQEAGASDAEVIEEELKRTAPGSGKALYPYTGSIGDTYTEDQKAAPGGDEHIELKRIAGEAYAISTIADTTFAAATGNTEMGRHWLETTRENLDGIGSSDEAEAAREVLGGIIDNMVSVMPVPED